MLHAALSRFPGTFVPDAFRTSTWLPASGSTWRRQGLRESSRGPTARRATEGEDEDANALAALLAQAEALRREAAEDERSLRADKGQREEEGACAASAQQRQGTEAAQQAVLLAEAKLSIAQGKLLRLQQERATAGAADGGGASLDAARRAVDEAKSAPSSTTSSWDLGAAAAPSRAQPPKGCMTPSEWLDLATKYNDMNWVAQWQTNARIGPQGQRKLEALRVGDKAGVFVLPGERVRLLGSEYAYRSSFRRFQDEQNGVTEAKLKRMGQECVIQATFNDDTLTCAFDDGVTVDFPFESIQGYQK